MIKAHYYVHWRYRCLILYGGPDTPLSPEQPKLYVSVSREYWFIALGVNQWEFTVALTEMFNSGRLRPRFSIWHESENWRLN